MNFLGTRRREGSGRRKLGRNPRIPFSGSQVAVLEDKFRNSPYLSSSDVAHLSNLLRLSDSRVSCHIIFGILLQCTVLHVYYLIWVTSLNAISFSLGLFVGITSADRYQFDWFIRLVYIWKMVMRLKRLKENNLKSKPMYCYRNKVAATDSYLFHSNRICYYEELSLPGDINQYF